MAEDSRQTGVDDVEVEEVWERLKTDPDAQLVDVRTQAEWAFVGVPDLTDIGKRLLCIEWQQFPGGQPNPAFTGLLEAQLAEVRADRDTELFFLCRSGQRSLHSAEALAAVGYRRCHNVAGGFEGPLDSNGHRGLVAGWKAAGLPWVQR